MPLTREIIETRAIKAGVKASKKRQHVVSEQELLSLRVQTMSAGARITWVLVGIALFGAGWFEWPTNSNTVQGIEAILGIFAIFFGAFGVRRTLSWVLDSFDAADLLGVVLETIGDAISNVGL